MVEEYSSPYVLVCIECMAFNKRCVRNKAMRGGIFGGVLRPVE